MNNYNFDGAKAKYTGSEAADYTVTDADFVTTVIPGYNASTHAYMADYHTIFRNADGSINVDGLFEVKPESRLYTAGENGTYIGAKFSVDGAKKTYTVSVTNGSAVPVKAEEGQTVTITANTIPGKEFVKWNVKTGSVTLADAAGASTTFVMPASLVEIEAEYKTATKPVPTPTPTPTPDPVAPTPTPVPEPGVTPAPVPEPVVTPTPEPTPTEDSDDDDDDSPINDVEAWQKERPTVAAVQLPSGLVVRSDSTISNIQATSDVQFKDSEGNAVTGEKEIILHMETVASPSEEIKAEVERLTAGVKNKAGIKVFYYDIKAYVNRVASGNVVTLVSGNVKIRFAYPENTSRNNTIIALHGTKEVPVIKEQKCFWVEADGFSPYTVIIEPGESSPKTGDDSTASVLRDEKPSMNPETEVTAAAVGAASSQGGLWIVAAVLVLGAAAYAITVYGRKREEDE